MALSSRVHSAERSQLAAQRGSSIVRVMKIATLVGTSRPGNYTTKALDVVEKQLRASGVDVTRFDPTGKLLPFPGQDGDFPDADAMREMIKSAEGLVIATPEYHGSFPAQLKLLIENMGFPSAMSGKPVALLGVAAGRIGAIKSLEQLRSVCSHVGAIVLPGPISIAGVNRQFNERGELTDKSTGDSLVGLAQALLDYLEHNVCPRRTLEAMMRES